MKGEAAASGEWRVIPKSCVGGLSTGQVNRMLEERARGAAIVEAAG